MPTSKFAEKGADLEVRKIHKHFPGFTAIESLDLKIPAGSFFALLGPSGSGKTTMLRIIAGLEEATSGEVLIGGEDVTHLKPHKRPVNTVFQSYALFPHMTILENVAFGLRRRGIDDPVGKAHEALKLVELDHIADRKPAQLSGGQQQRVALARAVVNRPALLLLDEPLGALDLKLRRQMQHELKQIQQEVGLTFVHVTHDQEEAMTMADTVAVMNHGRIEQMGAPAELYDLPKTVFVANFLGRSNLFTGSVREVKDDTVFVNVDGVLLEVPEKRSEVIQGQMVVGVRPEKMHLHTEEPANAPGTNVLGPGVITDVSFMGVSTEYTVEIEGQDPIQIFEQNRVAGPGAELGERAWVTWDAKHAFGLPYGDLETGTVDTQASTTTIAAQAGKN